ncbi:carboxypeptidase regulatory-like domain-containing protein [Streptomyces sp. NPDC051664]|uniref:carboxypeptidase regulatory-like domain-containing protein n=1 Tax=Streptomyces sp. NPDC051664 TaxID=3365668 RepID=UPI0037910889
MRTARLRPSGGRAGRAVAAVAGLMSAALAVVGLQLPTAAPAVGAPTAKAAATAVRQCGDPKPGQFACMAMRRTDVAARRGVQPLSAIPAGFGADDLASAYALPADGGAGQTIAIVDAFDDPTVEADLAVYRQQYGLPACTTANGCFTKVDQRGGTNYPSADPGWAGEISLDVDMVSAAAPNAHILLIEADSPGFADLGAAVDQAVALGAKYVSNSYGTQYDSTPGSGEDPSELTAMDPYYNHPGVAVVASSGDSSYGVAYPAASQYVTSVGGTALVKNSGAGRGWSESAWHGPSGGGPGSGCSLYEPKPAFQTDTACANRTVADVSAVADPATGVSVYQTYGAGGWEVFGGTSASAPLIAGVYADAGTPAAGTYPNAYPYAQADSLNDVTTGSNGTCTPALLCTAGPGYDGPTGLGTPHGINAFRTGPHGVISGTVTDRATGKPIAGVTVKAGDNTAISNASGTYRLDIPAGTYDMTASVYGYATGRAAGVVLADGGTVAESFSLDALPTQTVSGKVTDGSGHGWPLYAKITADRVPGGPVFTDPATGAYSLKLPQGASYTLHVTANYPGYQAVDKTVQVATADQRLNIPVPVDSAAAQAPGYAVHLHGPTEAFDSASGPTDGWSVANADGKDGGWTFDDPGSRDNHTGGSGGFATVDSDSNGVQVQDSSLVSPSYDLSSATTPILAFDTDYAGWAGNTADVDISSDGGTTWTTVWQKSSIWVPGPAHIELPLGAYAGKSDVRVRFHYTTFDWGMWWQLDDVFLGQRTYDPVPGALLVGHVTDANTRAGVNGATVTSNDASGDHTTSTATPDDPQVGDGFYWMFSHLTGNHPVAAVLSHYSTTTDTVNITPDATVKHNLPLKAGRLKLTPASIAKNVAWGKSAGQTVTVTNDGTSPATLDLTEKAGGFIVQRATAARQRAGAPLHLVKGSYSALRLTSPAAASEAGQDHATTRALGTPGTAWQPVADLPTATGDNAVDTYQGTVYSAFGSTGGHGTKDLYAYNGGWTKLASAADTRDAPAHGMINGKIYAVGGWGASGSPDGKLEIYDIATNAWSTGAMMPKPYAGAGSAVLDGKLYSVGGCFTIGCGSTDVSVYDPDTDTWSMAAPYPQPVSWESCGAIADKLYCSGGEAQHVTTKHAYVYDPATDTWSPVADQPTDAWGASYASANGLLLIRGGSVDNGTALTNQVWAYEPNENTWTALPNANTSVYRGGGSLGFYAIGGLTSGGTPVKTSEVLPGYDQEHAADVTWLAESADTVTVQPGASKTVTVTLDASVPEITQPGTHTAALIPRSDTPYRLDPLGVSLTVKPPTTWGKIAGTVTAAGGSTIAGATVQVSTWATHYTLKTAADGSYALWLDARNNPLQVIAAKDGYQPLAVTVKVKKGATTVHDFTLLTS